MTDFDLELSSGRIRARRWGDESNPLVLCGHGLSANLTSFGVIAGHITGTSDRQVVAIDFRGRGRSEVTPPGTYGLDSHARDVLEVATRLGRERFDYIGWSMGALIGARAAVQAPERIGSLGMIDLLGPVEPAAGVAVRAGLARLDVVVPAPEHYLAAIRAVGAITPWSAFWDEFYTYELRQTPDGTWTPSTDKPSCEEDLEDLFAHDWPASWRELRAPTTVVRCTQRLGDGYVVPADVRDAFAATVEGARIVDVDAGHFTVLLHPQAIDALAA